MQVKKAIFADMNHDQYKAIVYRKCSIYTSKGFPLILKMHFTAQCQYSLGTFFMFPLAGSLYNV